MDEGYQRADGAAGGQGSRLADEAQRPIVVVLARDFRLPEVLGHIEAGRIVRVVLAEQSPEVA